MDLSKLSDSDLQAILNNDMSAMSDAGLKILSGPSPYEQVANEQSFGQNLLAGIGGGITSMYLGGKQALGLASEKEIRENREAMEGLRTTTGGKVGDVVGKAALAAPAMFIPGANTYAGAALTGAAMGAVEPVLDDESRWLNAGFGALGGAAGMGAGRAIGAGFKSYASRAAANAASRQAQNAARDSVLSSARANGYSVPPSYMETGLLPRLMEGVSGKYKTNQLAGINNQKVTNKLAKKALGMADDSVLSKDGLSAIRTQAFNDGYTPIRGLGEIQTDAKFKAALDALEGSFSGARRSFPGAQSNGVDDVIGSIRVDKFDAGDAIDMTRLLRNEASKAYAAGNKELGKAARAASDELESQIERHLFSLGDDGAAALKNFRDARALMAKTHSVESALVDSTGYVDATKLAAKFSKGKPLSAELKDIGRFGQAFPDVARVPKSGNANPLTVYDYLTGTSLGVGVNPWLAGLPFARVGARNAILSPAMQKMMQPNYSTGGRQLVSKALNSNTARAIEAGLGAELGLLSPNLLPANK